MARKLRCMDAEKVSQVAVEKFGSVDRFVKEVYAQTGVNIVPSALREWRNGRRPSVDTFEAMAYTLGVESRELLMVADEQPA